MYKQIDKGNKVFQTNEFLKDRYKYYIVLQILENNNPIIYSNEQDYFLIRSDNDHPVWIWTKDNIDNTIIHEIEKIIELLSINDDRKNKFTCKKELFDLLLSDNFSLINKDDYFEMGVLYCKNTKKPKKCDGYLDKANIYDIDILTEYWYQDNLETGDGNINLDSAKKDVEDMLDKGNAYVLRNIENKVVCMSNYTVASNVARINHVFTPKEERSKGYCANLIYNLSNKLLAEDVIPMLYTDYNYIPSNKSYINAGYIKDGILVSFSCSKEGIK